MVLKKIKVAQRFGDLETAFGFAEENNIVYDEVIVLFDHVQEIPEKEEVTEDIKDLPEHKIDKDKVIKDLLKENAELKEFQEHGVEIPKPPKPVKKGIFAKKENIKTETRETR